MNIEKLKELAKTDFTDIIQSENNVKYNIVIPFLQAFNHTKLGLEHAAQGSRIDINIGNTIIVETKALNQNINMHVQQLSDYSGKELPVLSILTNGRHFRIYSPQWRQLKLFSEKVIYDFEIKDLENEILLNRLEKILDFTFYKSEEFLDHIEQREKEIGKIKSEIEERKRIKKSEVTDIKEEIETMKIEIQNLSDQIKRKENFVSDIENDRIPEIQNFAKDYFIPILFSNHDNITQRIPATYKPQVENSNSQIKKVGQRFVINSPKNGTLAYGYLLETQEFVVEKGSTVCINVAPKFQTSARKAYEMREGFIRDGIIDRDRKFTIDKVFNSISLAASVIMGDSKNGNKEWCVE